MAGCKSGALMPDACGGKQQDNERPFRYGFGDAFYYMYRAVQVCRSMARTSVVLKLSIEFASLRF